LTLQAIQQSKRSNDMPILFNEGFISRDEYAGSTLNG
jgi:hypothetical protein